MAQLLSVADGVRGVSFSAVPPVRGPSALDVKFQLEAFLALAFAYERVERTEAVPCRWNWVCWWTHVFFFFFFETI